MPRRLLVARVPRRLPSGPLLLDASSVGVLRVTGAAPPGEIRPAEVADGNEWLVVVIATALPLDAGPDAPFGPAPAMVPGDFVPWRPTTDVVLLGTSDPGPITVSAGAHERRFATRSPAGRSPLRGGLVTTDGVTVGEVTATPPEAMAGTRWLDPTDVERSHATPPPLRFPALRGDEVVAVRTPSGEGAVALPGMLPRIRVVSAMDQLPDQEHVAFVDEVLIDVDRRVGRVVYRALVPITRPDARDVDRLDVMFARIDDRDALGGPFVDHDVPRAELGPAWELWHAEEGTPPPPLDPHDLQIARYETWDCASPLPALPLHEAASISAELAEQREPRDVVLGRRGVTPYDWELEERAWGEALGQAPAEEDQVTLAHLWGNEFQKAQDALATPEEASRGADDYARVAVALEGTHPDEALRDHGIGLGAYQRLDRRMQAQAAADPAFARELEALLERERDAARARHAPDRVGALVADEEGAS